MDKAKPDALRLADDLASVIADLEASSDRAYCDYIEKMRRPECLGWEHKAKIGQFGQDELTGHTRAGELLGRHRALADALVSLSRLHALAHPAESAEATVKESLTARAEAGAVPAGWRELLRQSEDNFLRQYGVSVAAAWVYRDLEELLAASPASPAQAAGMVLPPLDQDLIDILGRPNFQCIRIAQLFRQAGAEIATKAENEQAAVIHFLLSMYLQHGKEWATAADEHLKALVQQVNDKALAAREGGE